MADIIHALATSHGPQLSMPPDTWELRRSVDRSRRDNHFRSGIYNYGQLLELRAADRTRFIEQIRPEVQEANYRRSQAALDALARQLQVLYPDIVVLIGDDQREWYQPAIQPALSVLTVPQVLNKQVVPGEYAHSPGIDLAISGWRPPADQWYPVHTELAHHLVGEMMQEGFDVTVCSEVPTGPSGPLCITHSLGFVVRRLMADKPVPLVPILLNTFYPPNQVKPSRCFDFGRSIAAAVRSWKGKPSARVVLCASGGLSHYVIDEEWDRKMLDAMLSGDEKTLRNEPDDRFGGGTSETKNWITLCGAMSTTNKRMKLLDYVPCYRSEAGTGNAMAFAIWE